MAKKALRKKENEKFELECVFYLKIKKKCFLFFSLYVILIEIAFFWPKHIFTLQA